MTECNNYYSFRSIPYTLAISLPLQEYIYVLEGLKIQRILN